LIGDSEVLGGGILNNLQYLILALIRHCALRSGAEDVVDRHSLVLGQTDVYGRHKGKKQDWRKQREFNG
jgi:hypothetical protein